MPRRVFQANRWPFWEAKRSSSEYTNRPLPYSMRYMEEATEKIGTSADVIINIQGDEPFIQQSQIETLMQLFDFTETQIGTLGKPFDTMDAVLNPNSPKIVCDKRGFALYFSRSVIPSVRSQEQATWIDHYPLSPDCRNRPWNLPRVWNSSAGWRTATASAWVSPTSKPSA